MKCLSDSAIQELALLHLQSTDLTQVSLEDLYSKYIETVEKLRSLDVQRIENDPNKRKMKANF